MGGGGSNKSELIRGNVFKDVGRASVYALFSFGCQMCICGVALLLYYNLHNSKQNVLVRTCACIPDTHGNTALLLPALAAWGWYSFLTHVIM